jgi:hypothetical protein
VRQTGASASTRARSRPLQARLRSPDFIPGQGVGGRRPPVGRGLINAACSRAGREQKLARACAKVMVERSGSRAKAQQPRCHPGQGVGGRRPPVGRRLIVAEARARERRGGGEGGCVRGDACPRAGVQGSEAQASSVREGMGAGDPRVGKARHSRARAGTRVKKRGDAACGLPARVAQEPWCRPGSGCWGQEAPGRAGFSSLPGAGRREAGSRRGARGRCASGRVGRRRRLGCPGFPPEGGRWEQETPVGAVVVTAGCRPRRKRERGRASNKMVRV